MQRLALGLALLLLVLPFGVYPLGLGDVEVHSALNEPLDASITLHAVKDGDIADLTVRIASKDQFLRAGISRAFFLTSLQFSTFEGVSPGTGKIRISTFQPVTEPFLNFLLDVGWRRGRVIREYTILLDPPIYGAAISTAVEQVVTTVDELQVSLETPSPPSSTEDSVSSQGVGLTTIGPVKSTDTLWSIAERVRPDGATTVQQTMLALLNANPDAFADGNINALQAGAILRIPSLSELRSITVTDALAEVKRQHALWEEYRESANAAVAQQTEGDSESSIDSSTSSGESIPQSVEESSQTEDSSRIDIVSAGSGDTGVGGHSEDVAALHDELNMALEEADSQRRENSEVRARLDEADAIIAKLHHAVSIKDDDIAALQNELAKIQSELETKKSTLAAEELKSASDVESESSSELLSQPDPVPIFESSFNPFNNPIILSIVGGGLLIVVLLVVVFARRRRSTESEALGVSADASSQSSFADTNTPAVERGEVAAASSSEDGIELSHAAAADEVTELPLEFDDEAISPADKASKVEPEDDPFEGLNIYLAYEDYENATKLVKGVIAQHPDRHEFKLRLLEIYHSSKNILDFETTARELRSKVGDDSPMMDSTRRWWEDLAVGYALFHKAGESQVGRALDETIIGAGKDDEIFDVTKGGDGLFDSDGTLEISLDEVEAQGDGGGVDFDLGFEFETDVGESAAVPGSASQGHTLDFEITDEDIGSDGDGLQDVGLDFDLGLESDPSGESSNTEGSAANTLDFELDVDGHLDTVPTEEVLADEPAVIEPLTLATHSDVASTSETDLDFSIDADDSPQAVLDNISVDKDSELEDGIDLDLEFDPSASIEPAAGDELVSNSKTNLGTLDDDSAVVAQEHGTLTSSADELDCSLDLEAELPSENAHDVVLPTDTSGLDEVLSELDESDDQSLSDTYVDVGLSQDILHHDEAGSVTEPSMGQQINSLHAENTDSSQDDFDLPFDLEDMDGVVISSDEDSELGAEESFSALELEDLAGSAGVSDSDVKLSLELDSLVESPADTVPTIRDDDEERGVGLERIEDTHVDSDEGLIGDVTISPLSLEDDPDSEDDSEFLSELDADNEIAEGEDLDFELEFDEPTIDQSAMADSSNVDSKQGEALSDEDDFDFLLDLDEFSETSSPLDSLTTEKDLGGELVDDDDFDLALDLDVPSTEQSATLESIEPVGEQIIDVSGDDDFDFSLVLDDDEPDIGTPAFGLELDVVAGEAPQESDSAQFFQQDTADESVVPGARNVRRVTLYDPTDTAFTIDEHDTSEQADVANINEVDDTFGLGETADSSVSGTSDYQRTQYMLRDIANISSDDQETLGANSDSITDGGDVGELGQIQTKLDLAQAYIDMGDKDGARDILAEVMTDGNEDQQNIAQQLMSQLD